MTVKSTVLDGTIRPILTVAQNQQYAVTSMFYCSTAVTDSVLQVYIVASGDTPSNLNKIIQDLLITSGDTFTFDTEKIILDSGDSIQATITGGSISCTVSYVRVA
jgi:hypothetical protein